jgi:hypothetical protein
VHPLHLCVSSQGLSTPPNFDLRGHYRGAMTRRQSARSEAWASAGSVLQHAPLRIATATVALVCAVLTVLFAGASTGALILLAAGSAVGGPVLVGGSVFLAHVLRSPYVQRDRAWSELDRLNEPPKTLTDEQLAIECSRVGQAVQDFVMDRVSDKPLLELDAASGLPPIGESEAFVRSRQMNHDLHTLGLYGANHAPAVFRVLRALRERGLVSQANFDALNYPDSVGEVDRVGDRLLQLGHRMRGIQAA